MEYATPDKKSISHGLLTADSANLVDGHVDDLLVLRSITQTLIDDNLLQDGNLHCRGIIELLLQCGSNLLLVLLL